MKALNAVLEADLRAISAESRKKFPFVKDAAERAILKLRSLSDPKSISESEDLITVFISACETNQPKLIALGLSSLQKVIAHDAINPSVLPKILTILCDNVEVYEEGVQLKVLQTVLTVLQSKLFPEDEAGMSTVLGVCLRLVGNPRNVDIVQSTAAASLRQAVALIFDRVLDSESLPSDLNHRQVSRSRLTTGAGDMGRFIITPSSSDLSLSADSPTSKSTVDLLSNAGKLGLKLFEDLHSLAAGQIAAWLDVPSLPRAFALDMLEYVVSHYVVVFQSLGPFQQVLGDKVCSLLMTSLRTTGEIEEELGEPAYRRLVLRSVSTVTRLYSNILTTECEVFLTMLIKCMELELPQWHRIMVLEVLRGFCVEARVLKLMFHTFDMQPSNTNVVAAMVSCLSKVVQTVQVPDSSEESLAAVAGMFTSKANGVEWSMDSESSGSAVLVASEAHAITLAVEGLLGVVFTVAVLTDEAVEEGEIESPGSEPRSSEKATPGVQGGLTSMCCQMVEAVWRNLLEALSIMLARSHGEAVILEILKGYQAFTQSCGVLGLTVPRDAFLASLCHFTLVSSNDSAQEPDFFFKNNNLNMALSALSSLAMPAVPKRLDTDSSSSLPGSPSLSSAGPSSRSPSFSGPPAVPSMVPTGLSLSPKNVQSLRTLFNVAHRLGSNLGSAWTMVLGTLAAVDKIIYAPQVSTPEGQSGRQTIDFSVLVALDTQLFESTSMMHDAAVRSLLASLRSVSNGLLTSGAQSGLLPSSLPLSNPSAGPGVPSSSLKLFSVDRMIAVLSSNPHRVDRLWGDVTVHLLELADHDEPVVRSLAIDALDRAVLNVLNCGKIRQEASSKHPAPDSSSSSFESVVMMPISVLFDVGRDVDVRAGSLRILLHVLERHGEKLNNSWPEILNLLRTVADGEQRELVPLGFQSVQVILNDCLSSVPKQWLELTVEVTAAYSTQKLDVNISLTAVGLLWTAADSFARGLHTEASTGVASSAAFRSVSVDSSAGARDHQILPAGRLDPESSQLLLKVFRTIQSLGVDDRPEVRNSAIRTLFQSVVSHGSKLSYSHWKECLWGFIFPLLNTVRHLASTASQEEWVGTELGKQGGKSVHMLIHHSRNTHQKQWDESLGNVLGGISRLLRAFLPQLQGIQSFDRGWALVLEFVEESVLSGSKEVSIAAVNAVHSVLSTHAPKGQLSPSQWSTALLCYERLVREGCRTDSSVPLKARQDLMDSLSELYVSSGEALFSEADYLTLLALCDVAVRCPVTEGELKPPLLQGALPLLQRTVLDIFPRLAPRPRHASLWSSLVRQLAAYLPGGDHLLCDHCRVPPQFLEEAREARLASRKAGAPPGTNGDHEAAAAEDGGKKTGGSLSLGGNPAQLFAPTAVWAPTGGESRGKGGPGRAVPAGSSFRRSFPETSPGALSQAFAERVAGVIITLMSAATSDAKAECLPDVVAGMGRCMILRRDTPDSHLWRTALRHFVSLLDQLEEDTWPPVQSANDIAPHGVRLWRELSDTFEKFCLGTCGRATSHQAPLPPSPDPLSIADIPVTPDEELENLLLDSLCSKVLSKCKSSPPEMRVRLVTVLDRCASRTSTLPLPTLALLPPHCSRFSLNCLNKLFSLVSVVGPGDPPEGSRFLCGAIVLPTLISRCASVLQNFALVVKHQDAVSVHDAIPAVRVEEVRLVLQQLQQLEVQPKLAATLQGGPGSFQERGVSQIHLLALYGPLVDLVTTREDSIVKVVWQLLRKIGLEIGLLQSESPISHLMSEEDVR